MNRKILQIILADESRLFIDSLKVVIENRELNVKVMDTAQDSIEAVKKAEKERPDIILLDIDLPGMNGIDMIKEIRCKVPDTKIVILTANTDVNTIEKSLKNGVSGYILKDIALVELMSLLASINDKTIVLSRELVSMGISFGNNFRGKNKMMDNQHPSGLLFSHNEKSMLTYIIQGFSNREIAAKMYLAEQTVKNNISVLYTKLGVHNRPQAIQKGKKLFSEYQ